MTDLFIHIGIIALIYLVGMLASSYIIDWLMKEYDKAAGYWQRNIIWAVTTILSIVFWGWLMLGSMIWNMVFKPKKKKR